jgi:predicted RNase H-like nuclease (RuvC/YqgF family)
MKGRKVRRRTIRRRGRISDRLREENEMLKLQLMAREKERDEYKRELDEIHASISYRVGRWIAETKIGGWFKRILRKYVWK